MANGKRVLDLSPGDRVVVAGERRVVVAAGRVAGRVCVEHRHPTLASDAPTGLTTYDTTDVVDVW